MEVSASKQGVEVHAKNLNQTENTCKEILPRIDYIIDKDNRLGNKQYEGKGKWEHSEGLKRTGL